MGYPDGFLVQQASASRNPVISVTSIVTHKESQVLDVLQELNFKLCVHSQLLSRVQLFATPWTVAHQGSLSMGFPRQEYWSGLLIPPPPESPRPRDQTCFSCIGRKILYHCTTEKPQFQARGEQNRISILLLSPHCLSSLM